MPPAIFNGATADGGVAHEALRHYGTIFKLSPNTGGGWTETLLHTFGKGDDGRDPDAPLVFDAAGNLYGTTIDSGNTYSGTVFELSPGANGQWTETVLYRFAGGTDGTAPFGGLIFDTAGNLYGTTYQGGTYAAGTVFELSPQPGGGWTEKVLYSFGNGTDGYNPVAGLTMDRLGNLYGTTLYGGVSNNCFEFSSCGTVFELSPQPGGGWTESVLHNFGNGTDGQYPYAGVILDGAGNLYGTTWSGGLYNNCVTSISTGCGTVFELSPNQGGGWTESVLHNFGNGSDGQSPEAGLIFDATGHLYGTTQSGGAYLYYGTVFELSPLVGGGWTETVLHTFGNGADGGFPYYGGVVLDAAGNLFGTTVVGGAHSTGTVYEITP
jgi:uncharacterized repeat protein (TIGR03803 family)